MDAAGFSVGTTAALAGSGLGVTGKAAGDAAGLAGSGERAVLTSGLGADPGAFSILGAAGLTDNALEGSLADGFSALLR